MTETEAKQLLAYEKGISWGRKTIFISLFLSLLLILTQNGSWTERLIELIIVGVLFLLALVSYKKPVLAFLIFSTVHFSYSVYLLFTNTDGNLIVTLFRLIIFGLILNGFICALKAKKLLDNLTGD